MLFPARWRGSALGSPYTGELAKIFDFCLNTLRSAPWDVYANAATPNGLLLRRTTPNGLLLRRATPNGLLLRRATPNGLETLRCRRRLVRRRASLHRRLAFRWFESVFSIFKKKNALPFGKSVFFLATPNGLEPSTSSVTGWRANRLHHRARTRWIITDKVVFVNILFKNIF